MLSGNENSNSNSSPASGALSSIEQEQRARLSLPLSANENPLRTRLINAEKKKVYTVLQVAKCVTLLTNFCNNEARGYLPAIIDDTDVTDLSTNSMLINFDKEGSTLIWMADEEPASKEIFQHYVNETILTSALGKIYDNYVERLIYLVKLTITIQDFFSNTFSSKSLNMTESLLSKKRKS
jgi:hypothetical protein